MSDLGTLGGNNSCANAINNSNIIVGFAGIDPWDETLKHAFIYAGGSMTDLNTLLDTSGAGWTLVQATDINDVGQIVGIGTYGGDNHGFLLTPLPQVTQQPTNMTVACAASASFTVAAEPLPLTCQWYHGSPPGGVAVANATNFSLTLSNVTGLQSGAYYAVVASTLASATSSVAALAVLDSTPPVLSGCPGNQTRYVVPGASGAVVTWSNPTATDSCDGAVAVFTTPTNGSTFDLGVTPVTCRASDSSGNTNTCNFTVSVILAEPPTITGAQVQGTNVVLSFTTQPAAHYALESRQILMTGSWDEAMTGITGTGGVVTVTNFGAAAVQACFYRVRLTLP